MNLILTPEQSGVVVLSCPAFRDDHLLRHDPGVLRRGHLQHQDGDAEVRPLWRLGPLLQRIAAGKLLDSPAD